MVIYKVYTTDGYERWDCSYYVSKAAAEQVIASALPSLEDFMRREIEEVYVIE